ncbi:hypothetical protein [Nocardiopsis protaetiae]|uniref:hypothetical protein n=1 Tax=Nocardiopsis protaetiae TaxID=3382270 RepID=UPI00387B29E1
MNAPWRTGRKLGRTLYQRVHTDAPSDDDRFLGIMDTREDAARVIRAINATQQAHTWHVTGRITCECCVELRHAPCDQEQIISGDLAAILTAVADHDCTTT